MGTSVECDEDGVWGIHRYGVCLNHSFFPLVKPHCKSRRTPALQKLWFTPSPLEVSYCNSSHDKINYPDPNTPLLLFLCLFPLQNKHTKNSVHRIELCLPRPIWSFSAVVTHPSVCFPLCLHSCKHVVRMWSKHSEKPSGFSPSLRGITLVVFRRSDCC